MNRTPFLTERPPALDRIVESVELLIVPSLGPLRQVFTDAQAGLAEERAGLLQQRVETRDEGYAAATRLMLSVAEDITIRVPGYFEQLTRSKTS